MKKKVYSYIIKYFILWFADILMNTYISHFLRLIKQLEKHSPSEIKIWRSNNIQSLIKHAYDNTEYYKQLFDQHNIDVDKIKNINDLEIIPILSKDDVRNNFYDIPSSISN